MLDLKHGHEDELEMNLHRDLSFDLRLCSEFDKLSCAIQNQVSNLFDCIFPRLTKYQIRLLAYSMQSTQTLTRS